MPQHHPAATTSANTPVGYAALARWAESEAGGDVIADALSRPDTPEEKALAEEHDAIVRRILADYRNNPDQGR